MSHMYCPTWRFKLGHFINGLGQTMIFEFLTTDIIVGSWSSGGWLSELTSPASLPSLSSPSSCFSGSTAILFCVKNEFNLCCRFDHNERKRNNKLSQQRSTGTAWNIHKKMYAEHQNLCSSLSRNCMEHLAQKLLVSNEKTVSHFAHLQACKHTFFFKCSFIVAWCFGIDYTQTVRVK